MHTLSARAAFSLWAKRPGVVSALSILFGLHISWVSIGHSDRIERIGVFVQKCVCVLGSERNEGKLQYCWAGQSATGWLEMSGATESRLMRIRRTRKARLFPFLAAHFYSRCWKFTEIRKFWSGNIFCTDLSLSVCVQRVCQRRWRETHSFSKKKKIYIGYRNLSVSAKEIAQGKKKHFHYSFMSLCPVDLKDNQSQSGQKSLPE